MKRRADRGCLLKRFQFYFGYCVLNERYMEAHSTAKEGLLLLVWRERAVQGIGGVRFMAGYPTISSISPPGILLFAVPTDYSITNKGSHIQAFFCCWVFICICLKGAPCESLDNRWGKKWKHEELWIKVERAQKEAEIKNRQERHFRIIGRLTQGTRKGLSRWSNSF